MFLRIIIEFENLVFVGYCLLCPELYVPKSAFWPKLRWDPLKLVKASGAWLVRLEADLSRVVVGFVNFVMRISSYSRPPRQAHGCELSLALVIN